MNTTTAFLDAIKQRHNIPSDYALAKRIGCTQQTISRYRVGKDFLGDSTAIKVAELLEMDPALVIAAVHCERAKVLEEKKIWTSIIERLGGIAAALIVGVGVGVAPAPAEASPAQNSQQITLCKVRRRHKKPMPKVIRDALNPLQLFSLKLSL